jgi:hypothetical protein
MSAREIVEAVFTEDIAEKIWTANTMAVLPLTPQNVAVGSVLPAVFFMCRRGYRRGKGRFQEAFAPPCDDRRATIDSVALRLSQDQELFSGFDKPVQRDILGDLLLCDALENKAHAEGHTAEVARAFPVHFFASWLDLPKSVAHMRFVPEMLVCLLANQKDGLKLRPGAQEGSFPVGAAPDKNLLFKIFARGVQFGDNPVDYLADGIDEAADLSIEELLMVRVAQACGEAPETMHAGGAVADIQNFLPIAHRSNEVFREDFTAFLEHYGAVIPRRSIAPMIEALIGLSVAHASLASFSIAVAWDKLGRFPEVTSQSPVPLFVDASCGNNSVLRDLSEQSYEEVVRLVDQATISLAQIRILDAISRDDPDLQQFKPTGPDNSAWLNLLADVRNNRHETSALALRDLRLKLNRLADRLTEEGIEPDAVDILRAPTATQRPVHTVAEAICAMMGEKILRHHYLAFLDSCLMINEAHGLGRKRRVSRSLGGRKRKMMDLRSLILSNTVLEALVHLHLAARQGTLSFAEFIRILRDRYGFWVDEAPPGVPASRQDLLTNRDNLERRLRDLGLLVGVNDAEFMKHLRPRFKTQPRT